MAGQNAPPAQDQTGSLDFLWGSVAIIAIALIIWFVFKDYIVMGLCTLKLWELHFATLYSSEAELLIPIVEYYVNHPEQVDFPTVKLLMSTTGKFISIPFAILCVSLAAIIYFGPFTSHFRHIYNLKTLYDSQKNLWPQILPISKLDLLNTPIDQGPWAMTLNPMEFARKYQLIREVREQGVGEKLIQRGMKIRAEVIKDKAERVFTQQLGPLWEGVDKLNDYTKALYAAFVARANHDRAASLALLNSISASSENGKPDFSGTKKVLDKYRNDKRAIKIGTQHAYVSTVMASMLELARTDGVLSSADFLWLKPVDRKLWYILNNVGRQTAFTEVAGIFAHWVVEKQLQRRFSVPMVHEAVVGLEKALTSIIYQSEEENA